jgi:bis(5'-nucleosyl)-tetraphosphatase (symmetrical)
VSRRCYARGRDTLAEVLAAPDRDELVAWLRERPLLHREAGVTMVHAGLLPDWTVAAAEGLAREAEAQIREPAFLPALFAMKAPERWDPGLTGLERQALTVTALTRVRTVTADGRMCAKFSGHPNNAPEECVPWYDHPQRRSRGERIVFGHWAALGLHLQDDAVALDTGCVWGGSLTAYRLDDGTVEQEPSAER